MSNGNAMIMHLIVGLVEKTLYKKWVNTFLNRMIDSEERLVSKLISNYATNRIWKKQQELKNLILQQNLI